MLPCLIGNFFEGNLFASFLVIVFLVVHQKGLLFRGIGHSKHFYWTSTRGHYSYSKTSLCTYRFDDINSHQNTVLMSQTHIYIYMILWKVAVESGSLYRHTHTHTHSLGKRPKFGAFRKSAA